MVVAAGRGTQVVHGVGPDGGVQTRQGGIALVRPAVAARLHAWLGQPWYWPARWAGLLLSLIVESATIFFPGVADLSSSCNA